MQCRALKDSRLRGCPHPDKDKVTFFQLSDPTQNATEQPKRSPSPFSPVYPQLHMSKTPTVHPPYSASLERRIRSLILSPALAALCHTFEEGQAFLGSLFALFLRIKGI
jgi:hypothetical protein